MLINLVCLLPHHLPTQAALDIKQSAERQDLSFALLCVAVAPEIRHRA